MDVMMYRYGCMFYMYMLATWKRHATRPCISSVHQAFQSHLRNFPSFRNWELVTDWETSDTKSYQVIPSDSGIKDWHPQVLQSMALEISAATKMLSTRFYLCKCLPKGCVSLPLWSLPREATSGRATWGICACFGHLFVPCFEVREMCC